MWKNIWKKWCNMFNIVDNIGFVKYYEISQNNPLRWKVLFKESDDTFSTQSGEIKCKDFFNDIVAFHKAGKAFEMYNFNNKIKFNLEGLYFLLTNIAKPDLFIKNVEIALNTQLEKDLGNGAMIQCQKQDATTVIVCLPMPIWDTTYYVSLATMMLRLCNNDVEVLSWEDFFHEASPLNISERAFNINAKVFTKKNGFALPEDKKDFWFYANKEYHSKAPKEIYISNETIHNCGVCSWVKGMGV